MKTIISPFTRFSLLVLVLFALACGKDNALEPIGINICEENPCGYPDRCPDACNDGNGGTTDGEGSDITRDDLTPEGNVTETETGYLVEGSLSMETESGETITFVEADLDVQFNEDGSLRSISGSSDVPISTDYFEFEAPVRADIGFFNGKFLNENRDFEILLQEDRWYFVFAISASFGINIGFNDDPEATKPLSISPPIGGHVTLIQDYTDPMFFFSLGHDDGLGGDGGTGDGSGSGDGGSDGNSDGGGELLGVSFGVSHEGLFIYEPTNPVDKVVSFNASTVKGGTFTFWGVLQASGLRYENKGFGASFYSPDPLDSDFEAGYRSGINGELEFSLDIASFVSFGFPIGEGSTAIEAVASTDGGVTARAFFNGLVDPDLSWWPDFIPIVPNNSLQAYGYVEDSGWFDIGLSGVYGLDTPGGFRGITGDMRATPEALTLEGTAAIDEDTWNAFITFTADQTRVVTTPPVSFTDGISETVTAQIDDAIATTEQALEDLQKANEQYELELSLRGLRAALPGIVDEALDIIDDAVDAAIKSARDQRDQILEDYDRVACSDNITSQVNAVVKPYKDALNRLKNAVDASNDNAQTRIEIEDALRDLAALDKINKTVTVSITHGGTLFKCSQFKQTDTRSVTINRTVISSEYKAKLLEAADNVKYISEADGIRFDAQVIVDELPTLEELNSLKDSIESCVAELTENIGDVGFIYHHETKTYTHFMVIGGEEKEVGSFDIFSQDQLIENARLEVSSCNASDELNKLYRQAKSR